jgi:hypothetical protein
MSWRKRYEVWLQSLGRDRDDRGYAAKCLDCQGKWLCERAGSRREAFDICKDHEDKKHND